MKLSKRINSGSKQPTGEIVWASEKGVHQASESVVGHKRLSATATVMSAPEKKQKFPIFIQRSVAGDQLDAA